MSADQFDLLLYDTYCADFYLPPVFGKWKIDFKRASYSHWAIKELRDFVVQQFYPRTVGSIEEFCQYVTKFADTMFGYMRLSRTEENSMIFQTASDTAADVLDLLEALK